MTTNERIFNLICHVYNRQLSRQRGAEQISELSGGEFERIDEALRFENANDPIDVLKIIKNKYGGIHK
jgi:hypothetical protein